VGAVRGARDRRHLSTFGHLLYDGNDFAAWQWASLLADGVLGLAVLA
jgi:hypothetical protein